MTTPAALADRITAIADRVKTEISDDIAEGVVPADISDFGDLHDHVDANTYGGLCEENGDIDTPDLITIQDIVHAWLQAGRPAA